MHCSRQFLVVHIYLNFCITSVWNCNNYLSITAKRIYTATFNMFIYTSTICSQLIFVESLAEAGFAHLLLRIYLNMYTVSDIRKSTVDHNKNHHFNPLFWPKTHLDIRPSFAHTHISFAQDPHTQIRLQASTFRMKYDRSFVIHFCIFSFLNDGYQFNDRKNPLFMSESSLMAKKAPD